MCVHIEPQREVLLVMEACIARGAGATKLLKIMH